MGWLVYAIVPVSTALTEHALQRFVEIQHPSVKEYIGRCVSSVTLDPAAKLITLECSSQDLSNALNCLRDRIITNESLDGYSVGIAYRTEGKLQYLEAFQG